MGGGLKALEGLKEVYPKSKKIINKKSLSKIYSHLKMAKYTVSTHACFLRIDQCLHILSILQNCEESPW